MAAQFQVIKLGPNVGYGVFKAGGRRSTLGANYTGVSAEFIRSWLIEREAGYPSLASFRTGSTLPVDREFACTACTGGVQQHARFPSRPNCTGPCCRKPPKRARRRV